MATTLVVMREEYGPNVYPLYKDLIHEPFMPNNNGIGYKGVLLLDKKEDKIQCSLCGNWYSFLPSHIYKHHAMSVDDYRDEFEIRKGAPLCSKSFSKTSSDNAKRLGLKPPLSVKATHQTKEFRRKVSLAIRKERNKIMARNNYNLCDAQIGARLIVVRDIMDKKNVEELKMNEINKYDPSLVGFLQRKYKSWEEAAKAIKLKKIDGKKYEGSELIGLLRTYVLLNKRIPSVKDCKKENGIADNATYRRRFGSWRRAKMMAGLDQLLEEVKNG
jgi:hypothetical protein